MAFVSVSNNFDGVIYWVRTQKLAVMIAPFDSPSSLMYNLPDESTETRDQDSPR
jgi:hypothetical protein